MNDLEQGMDMQMYMGVYTYVASLLVFTSSVFGPSRIQGLIAYIVTAPFIISVPRKKLSVLVVLL